MHRPRLWSEEWWRLLELVVAGAVNEAALFLAIARDDKADGLSCGLLTMLICVWILNIIFPL